MFKELELKKFANELNIKNSEKEVLLKEIHHRVKNNLQLILSFLNLEQRFHRDSPDDIIMAVKSRIQSMAFVHEKTYNSPDLVNINVEDFTKDEFQNLIDLHNAHEINTIMDIDSNLEFSMEALTTLSLIANELFTNTLKYAFDEDQEYKEIFLSISETDGIVTIISKDNGKGLPEGMDIYDSPSLGLTIINQLTKQLDGSFKLLECDGAGYMFEFPLSTL